MRFLPFYFFLFLFTAHGTLSAQKKQLDSLNTIIRVSKNDTEKVKTYIALAEMYAYSKPDTMATICQRALAFIEKSGSHNKEVTQRLTGLKSMALNDIGYSYYIVGKNEDALKYYDQAIDFAVQAGDSNSVSSALSNRGIIYRRQGNLPMALDNYMRAAKIAETADDENMLVTVINNIGRVYSDMGDTANSLAYLLKSVAITKRINDLHSYESVLTNLGALYYSMGNYSEAMVQFNLALEVNKKTGDREQYARILDQLGTYYYSVRDTQKALISFEKSLAIYDSIHSRSGLAFTHLNLGQTYYNLRDYEKAEKNALLSYEYAQKIKSKDNICNAAKLLYRIYKKKGDKLNALAMLEVYSRLRDSILTDQSRKAMFKKQFQYEYDKQAALAKVEQEKVTITHRITTIAISVGLFLVIVFSAFLFNRFRITKKQKLLIEEQKIIVDERNKEMLDSIHYAKRIQGALLASNTILKKNLPEYFVLYKPKDIVSGDFYWAQSAGNKFLLGVCDCTGHGVPGAFMSLLNISLLNETVIEKKITNPSSVLDNVRSSIISALNPEGTETESKDGMDSVLCSFDFQNMKMDFACANNPLWLLRNNSFTEFKPDKMPVGMHHGEALPFTEHHFDLQKNDIIYLFTDGFADQFGGPQGKKYKYRQLNEKLLAISDKPMAEQKKILEETFESWRGSLEQLDDVLIIGIKVL